SASAEFAGEVLSMLATVGLRSSLETGGWVASATVPDLGAARGVPLLDARSPFGTSGMAVAHRTRTGASMENPRPHAGTGVASPCGRPALRTRRVVTTVVGQTPGLPG